MKRLGICIYSYGAHTRAARDGHPRARFKDTLEFLDYCQQIGAGGAQMALSSKDASYAAKVRGKAESLHLYYEGQVSLPQTEADTTRFETEIRLARDAGADVVRTACLSGRRYETFDSAEAFREFTRKSWQSLTLAEPVVRKQRVRLAIENHKDWHAEELANWLKRLGSEFMGACVDTGNNLALLEEPMAVVEALAPFAFSTHIKDMGVQDDADGFLLSEVPLGTGFLDLKRMVSVLTRANPKVQFNLEMITRDPLKIPCLTDKYWATMESTPAARLAGALKLVREQRGKAQLPRTTGLSVDQQLAIEDENVKKSLGYARENLAL